MTDQFKEGQIIYSPHYKCCYKISYGFRGVLCLQGCDVLGIAENKPFETTSESDVYFKNCVLITDENRIEYSRKLQVGENLQRACDLLWNLQRSHGVQGLIPIIKQLQAIRP
jgi:hypothetical protein